MLDAFYFIRQATVRNNGTTAICASCCPRVAFFYGHASGDSRVFLAEI